MNRTTPLPFVGAVVRYGFLWSHQAEGPGAADARMDRPCVISILTGPSKVRRAFVNPITHTRPGKGAAHETIKLTKPTQRKLGLDDKDQWIVAAELNVFDWPGYELRMTSAGEWLYGVLPDPVLKALLITLKKLSDEQRARATRR